MADARNLGVLTCGVVADPELVNDGKILKLRLAADYAGSDSENKDNRTGYFDGTYFLSNDTPNAKFVATQVREGKLKKGSQVQITYSLRQDRFKTKDGNSASRVILIVDSLNYVSGSRPSGESNSETKPAQSSSEAQVSLPTQF